MCTHPLNISINLFFKKVSNTASLKYYFQAVDVTVEHEQEPSRRMPETQLIDWLSTLGFWLSTLRVGAKHFVVLLPR